MHDSRDQDRLHHTQQDVGLPDSVTGSAIFLDVDGTLIDIADSPDDVIVPARLAADLRAVSSKARGALALVSGRTLETIDRLFAPEIFPAAGLHGGEYRGPTGQIERHPLPPALEQCRPLVAELADRFPGVLVEDKRRALGVHYRAAPEAGRDVERAVEAIAVGSGGVLTTQRGKMVIELKPADAGKGGAVKRFMEEAPFRGRYPIAIGDDVTDEAMFEVVNDLGGLTFRVGVPDRPTAAANYVASPQLVRDWLASIESA